MNRLRSSLLLLALSAAAACGDDSNDPSPVVPGIYEATRFVLIESGSSPIDALAEGASLFMDITAEGTTEGELFIPAIFTEEGLEDQIVSMEGTYTQSGNTIDFQQEGVSFVRDATWVVGEGTITGVYNDAGTGDRIEVTLTAQ